jgi:hypothetical protein
MESTCAWWTAPEEEDSFAPLRAAVLVDHVTRLWSLPMTDCPGRGEGNHEAESGSVPPNQNLLPDGPVTLHSLTMSDKGTWRVITAGAIHLFRLSDSPQTVERTPTLGRPFPSRDQVLELESISQCRVGLPGYWETQVPEEDQPSDLLYWTLTRPIQRIEAAN